MKSVEITSKVENGNLKRNRPVLVKALQQFEGKTITIKISKARKQRTNSQNAYYWSVIIPLWKDILFNEWGEIHTAQSTHEWLKMNFNFEERVNESTGEITRHIKSTTDNSTTDQEIYHELCRRNALDMFNMEIPLPGEALTFKF